MADTLILHGSAGAIANNDPLEGELCNVVSNGNVWDTSPNAPGGHTSAYGNYLRPSANYASALINTGVSSDEVSALMDWRNDNGTYKDRNVGAVFVLCDLDFAASNYIDHGICFEWAGDNYYLKEYNNGSVTTLASTTLSTTADKRYKYRIRVSANESTIKCYRQEYVTDTWVETELTGLAQTGYSIPAEFTGNLYSGWSHGVKYTYGAKEIAFQFWELDTVGSTPNVMFFGAGR